MLDKIIGKIFDRSSSEKDIWGDLSENKSAETKKCVKCLKRVDVRFEKCPHCNGYEFLYDDA